MEFSHKPVLLAECIDGLNIRKNGIYVDGTLGGAGHSSVILSSLAKEGRLIGIDRDIEAIEASKVKLEEYSNVTYVNDNHENIGNILKELNIAEVDGILIDLGVSSYQLDEASRGFSYMQDSKLDMRMDKSQYKSADTVINEYDEESLKKIFFEYGEERYSKSIAKKICEERKIKRIETTLELVNIIKSSIPRKALNEKQHPAKRVFQAIRIEVNGELIELRKAIQDGIKCLSNGGRLCIITFHSLEDRIVKDEFLNMQGRCTCSKDMPICVCNYTSYGKVITRKPILPSEDELKVNPRSRSSKLRIFERIK